LVVDDDEPENIDSVTVTVERKTGEKPTKEITNPTDSTIDLLKPFSKEELPLPAEVDKIIIIIIKT